MCTGPQERSGFFEDVVLASEKGRGTGGGGGAMAVPIGGGGYCYCDAGCGANLKWGYTDNNSYGGCCADWAHECGHMPKDSVCMDARTQAQAVNLFVAHHTVMKLQTGN